MRLVDLPSPSLPEDLQHQEVLPLLVLLLLSRDSVLTRRRSNCLSSEIPGNPLVMNFLHMFSRRVCQMSGSGISTNEYGHSVLRSIKTRLLLSRQSQTPKEDAHQHLRNSLTLHITYLLKKKSSVLMMALQQTIIVGQLLAI